MNTHNELAENAVFALDRPAPGLMTYYFLLSLVQEVSIHQGPLQRLLGIADLRVRTAGGGAVSGPPAKQRQQEHQSGHVGHFRSVDNVEEIRDLILERLKRLRDAGLGDPDQAADAVMVEGADGEALVGAARVLLDEVRALRKAATG